MVRCLPAWFRFAQCIRRYRHTKEAFPHLVNAGKYSSTFLVVTFSTLHAVYSTRDEYSPFFYCYLLSALFSSVYTYVWDIKMDWGFFAAGAGENRFLREEIVYSSKSYYYFAIIEDLVLRFSWAMALALKENGFRNYSELIISVFAVLEVFRRFVWNFFRFVFESFILIEFQYLLFDRLENEHLNNCGKFRAVRDISVAPLDASDQQQIIKMMDDPDPTSMFRKKKILKSQGPVIDPLKVPLLSDSDNKPGRAAAALKSFHLGKIE